MRKVNTSFISKKILILAILISAMSYAQPGFDDDPGIDEPVAPINEWILAVAGLGVVYALYQVKKNTVKQ